MQELTNVSTFRLYTSGVEGVFTNSEDTLSTNLFYVFTRTNWTEASLRHWYVITAVDQDGLESLPSDFAHWPKYPPDHIRIFWSSNWPLTRVEQTLDFVNWSTVMTVAGTNEFSAPMDLGSVGAFYRIDKPEKLGVTVFNPNP